MRASWIAMLLLIVAILVRVPHGYSEEPQGIPPSSGVGSRVPKKASKVQSYRKSRLTSEVSEAAADHLTETLEMNNNKVIDLDFEPNSDPLKGITFGNDKVVFGTLVKVGDKNQLMLRPMSPGKADITLRDQSGEIKLIIDVYVANSDLIRIRDEIQRKLKEVEGINIFVSGNRVEIEGEVLTPQDYGKVYAVVSDKKYSEFVSSNYVTLSPLALQKLAERIQSDIQAFAAKVTAKVINGQIVLQGTVENEAQGAKAWDLANTYVPQAVPLSQIDKDPTVSRNEDVRFLRNQIIVEAPPPKKREKMVRVTVHFVELAKDYSKVFGFKWEPTFTADPTITLGPGNQGSPTGSGSGSTLNLTATLSSLIPKLASAQNAGYARVLKTANLIARSGQKANIFDQQSIPVTGFIGPGGQQVGGQNATIGMSIEVTPRILGQGENIELYMNVSENALTGIRGGNPIIGTKKLETNVYLRNNESAAVGGLTTTDVTTNFNRDDPRVTQSQGTASSPLFSLLRSKNYQKRKGQFVMFVTPQVVDDATEGSEELKKNFRVKVK